MIAIAEIIYLSNYIINKTVLVCVRVKTLTSIEGFLQIFTSLSATDSDDEDSVFCPGLQTGEL